jgi:hypothetical protein
MLLLRLIPPLLRLILPLLRTLLLLVVTPLVTMSLGVSAYTSVQRGLHERTLPWW